MLLCHCEVVNFLQESYENILTVTSVKLYIDPSPSTSARTVLRLRGGAAPEDFDEIVRAAKSTSLKYEISAKLEEASAFASAALQHLRH